MRLAEDEAQTKVNAIGTQETIVPVHMVQFVKRVEKHARKTHIRLSQVAGEEPASSVKSAEETDITTQDENAVAQFFGTVSKPSSCE